MKLHENNLNPKPFTAYGFKGESCRQAGLLNNSRTLVKSIAKSRHRLKTKSSNGFIVFERVVEVDVKRKKLKYIFKTYEGKQVFIITEFIRFKVRECIDAIEFRKQSVRLSIYPEKTGTIALNANICGFAHFDGVVGIYLGKSARTLCRTVKMHFGMIGSMHPDFQIPGNNLSGGERAVGLNGRQSLFSGGGSSVLKLVM